MDYQEYTIPKAVEESDKRQREDPNYKRPRKLPPRIVFRSVVKKAQQEIAAAGGAPLKQTTRSKLATKDKSYTALRITRPKKVTFKEDVGAEDNGIQATHIDSPANPATSPMAIVDSEATDPPAHHRSRSSSASSTDTIPLTIRATALTLPPPTPIPTRASLIAPSLSLPTSPVARMPTYDETDRLGRRFDSWTYTEAMATTSLIQHAFHELPYGAGGYGFAPLALRMVDKFALVAEMLEAVYGIKKTGAAVKNWWERDGRALTGMGDEKKVRPEGVAEGVEPARVGRGVGRRED